jgi:hypothetical protein
MAIFVEIYSSDATELDSVDLYEKQKEIYTDMALCQLASRIGY